MPTLHIKPLEGKKNLLAFSGGVDSTALFFMLLDSGVKFDIAIVDYQKREQSKLEVAYARELAEKHNLKIYTRAASIGDANFEHAARAVRYEFFEEIIKEYGYKNLLLAHQLNDLTEWFLMQFTRGAGVVEIVGMREIERRDRYAIVRPLLGYSKDELLEYLKERKIRYFVDESNFDEKYTRNHFRKEYSDRLVSEYKEGIKKSFEYLSVDAEELGGFEPIFAKDEFFIFESQKSDRKNMIIIDKTVKKLGILLSSAQRDEILSTRDCVVSGKIAVVITKDRIFIAPYMVCKMPKEFKEECRVKRIPPKIRGYLLEKKGTLSLL